MFLPIESSCIRRCRWVRPLLASSQSHSRIVLLGRSSCSAPDSRINHDRCSLGRLCRDVEMHDTCLVTVDYIVNRVDNSIMAKNTPNIKLQL